MRFWMAWRHTADKIWLLRNYSRLQWKRDKVRASRADFERSGIRHRQRCAVCRGEAHHRHHIIQLQHRGQNTPRNIISLCRACHRLVHAAQKPVVVSPALSHPCGPVRLVKKARITLPTDAGSSPLIVGTGGPLVQSGLALAGGNEHTNAPVN